jgi:hypothetical protein
MVKALLVIFLASSQPTGITVKTFLLPSDCKAQADLVDVDNKKGDAAAVACIDAQDGTVIYFRTFHE